jgi:hypothetical protein
MCTLGPYRTALLIRMYLGTFAGELNSTYLNIQVANLFPTCSYHDHAVLTKYEQNLFPLLRHIVGNFARH